jgi:hypothetical protein
MRIEGFYCKVISCHGIVYKTHAIYILFCLKVNAV